MKLAHRFVCSPTAHSGPVFTSQHRRLRKAGMGAYVYHTLYKRLEPHIQVMPLELPGHNSRMREALIKDLLALASQIADVIEHHITTEDRPYAILGHSMGAWIAFEVAHELRRRSALPPKMVIVACNRSPDLCAAGHDVDSTRLGQLDEGSFWPAFERRYGENKNLAHPAVRRAVYPILKADFTLIEGYQWCSATSPPLHVPITAVGAQLDNRYTKAQIAAWSRHTVSCFTELWLEDVGHNCMLEPPDSLVHYLENTLRSP